MYPVAESPITTTYKILQLKVLIVFKLHCSYYSLKFYLTDKVAMRNHIDFIDKYYFITDIFVN